MDSLQIFTSIFVSIFLGFAAGWIFFRKKFNKANDNVNTKIREITSTFKEKLNNSECKFNELKAKISVVDQKTIQDWDRLKKEADELHNADKAKTALLNNMEAEVKSRKSAIKELKAEIFSLKKKPSKQEAGESGKANQTEVESEKLAEIKSILTKERKAKIEIENQLKEQESKKIKLESQFTEKRRELSEFEKRLEKQQAKIAEIESLNKELMQQKRELAGQLEKQVAKWTELESRAELHENKKAELKEQIAKQQKEKEEVEKKLAEAIQRKSDLEENSSRHEAEIAKLKVVVAEVEIRIKKERESFLEGIAFVQGNHFLPGSVIQALIKKSAAKNNQPS